MEKSKYDKANPKVKKTKTEKVKAKKEKIVQEKIIKKAEQEVLEKVKTVREEKKKQEEIAAKKKASYRFKVDDKVRLIDGRACGIIEKIEKNKVVINYGMFTTSAKLDQLELVVAAKPKKK